MATSFETGWPDVQTNRALADWLEAAMKRDHLTSMRAVARYTGLSPDAVSRILHGGQPERLTAEKLAKKFPGQYQKIMALAGYSTDSKLDVGSKDVLMIPVQHSTVSAGFGNYSDFEVIPYVPRSHEHGHRFTALVVSGDCLAPDILPGHTVIVDLDASPMPGNTVVVECDHEILAKKLEKRNGELWLIARQNREPIKVDESVKILGVVTWIGHEP